MTEIKTWGEQTALIITGQGLLRLLVLLLLISMLSFLLGFAFVLLFQGLFLIFIQIALVYRPFYLFLIRILSLDFDQSSFIYPPWPKWKMIYYLLRSLIWIPAVVVGIHLLTRDGFLSQNLIYLLWFR